MWELIVHSVNNCKGEKKNRFGVTMPKPLNTLTKHFLHSALDSCRTSGINLVSVGKTSENNALLS